MKYTPLRNLVSFSKGAINEEMLDTFIQKINLGKKTRL